MPCYDERNSPSYIEEHEVKPLRQKLKRVEAMLCAVLTAIDARKEHNHTMWTVDWEKAGITRDQLEKWWSEHKAADARRREREQEELHRQNDIKAAKAKLTEREKKLLGLL